MKKSHSVRFWFLLFLAFYTCMSGALTIFVSLHTLRNLRMESAQNRQEILNFYMEQTDTVLRNAYYSLLQFGQSNEDLVALQIDSTSVSENSLHRSALRQDLLSLSTTQADVTGYCLYIESDAFQNDFFTYIINGSQAQVDSISRTAFLRLLTERLDSPDFSLGKWFVALLGDHYYLFCFTYISSAYIGCYINVDSLIKPLDEIEAQRGHSLFANSDGTVLTNPLLPVKTVSQMKNGQTYRMEKIEGQEYIVIETPSSLVDIRLVAFISNRTVFASFAPLFLTLIAIFLIITVLLPCFFFLFWSVLNSTFSKLLGTIEEIKAGNTQARAKTPTHISEMTMLNQSFNEMMDEIDTLKISVYEQKLKERQTYLDYLQIQIHPHFFLNCLNTVYSLAELKRYQEIKSLSLGLVKHLRFLFHRSSSLVTVEEELEHVKNYIAIHHFRFSTNTIDCRIQVAPCLKGALIPPLSIMTFVENSVKYGRNGQTCTEISVLVEPKESHMLVTVRDNGKGFPFDVLVALNAGKRLSIDETQRIGINNVRERLALLFGENASIRFYNNQGSVTEILLPLSYRNREEGDTYEHI